MILEKNLFVESLLPRRVLRTLTDAEMEAYRRPYLEPGEGRRPTLTWPRQLPIEGEPAGVVGIVSSYGAWLAASAIPKLFVNAEPGTISAEERKLMFEAKKILELPDLGVSAQCCRVGVAVGHYENAWVTFGKPVSLERIAALLADKSKTPFVTFLPGAAGEGLSALYSVKDRDNALVGRLRPDSRDKSGRTVCLTVVGDNLRLGAATNAVRIASRWFKSSDPLLQA